VSRSSAAAGLAAAGVVLALGLAACGAGGSAEVVTSSSPSPAGPLASPAVPAGTVVLARHTGHGDLAPTSVRHDGSYALLATCTGGEQVTVTTRAGREDVTAVPCSGFTSRMRFLKAESVEQWSVEAGDDQQWAVVWVDWSRDEG